MTRCIICDARILRKKGRPRLTCGAACSKRLDTRRRSERRNITVIHLQRQIDDLRQTLQELIGRINRTEQ